MDPDQITQISDLVAQYIASRRERFCPQAAPLSAGQRAAMDGFFLPHVLDAVRILASDGMRAENPPFYPTLAGMGLSDLPNFSRMAAITFCDVVVWHMPLNDGLLFHELVHVEQYRQFGVPRFSELYVRGFLSGGGYGSIPLEVNAIDLGRRFQEDPQGRFSVAEQVERWVREEKF